MKIKELLDSLLKMKLQYGSGFQDAEVKVKSLDGATLDVAEVAPDRHRGQLVLMISSDVSVGEMEMATDRVALSHELLSHMNGRCPGCGSTIKGGQR